MPALYSSSIGSNPSVKGSSSVTTEVSPTPADAKEFRRKQIEIEVVKNLAVRNLVERSFQGRSFLARNLVPVKNPRSLLQNLQQRRNLDQKQNVNNDFITIELIKLSCRISFTVQKGDIYYPLFITHQILFAERSYLFQNH